MFLLAFGRNLNYLNYSSLGLDSDFRVNIYYLNYVLFVAFLVWIVWISRVYEQDDLCVPRAYFFVSSQICGKVTIFFLNLQEKYKLFFKKIILWFSIFCFSRKMPFIQFEHVFEFYQSCVSLKMRLTENLWNIKNVHKIRKIHHNVLVSLLKNDFSKIWQFFRTVAVSKWQLP